MVRLFIKKIILHICGHVNSFIYMIRHRIYNLYHMDMGKRLIIYDDTFPSLLSPFRIVEINTYLDYFKNCVVYSNCSYKQEIEQYSKYYPEYSNRIFKFNKSHNFRGKLAYIVFLHNMFNFLPFIEKYKVPFVFELYPGGFFKLNDGVSDAKLKTIFNSKYFRKVIATQKITYDYLLENNFCPSDKIEFIYGGVLPVDVYSNTFSNKIKYPVEKNTFDICFVAHKNMIQGQDKGYDIFIETAKNISEKYSNILFHVVGNFDETDIDVNTIKENIHFYGSQTTSFFPEFYSKMDIILSPNRPHVLCNGAFDGFPTGCCVEAAFCGVAVFCTDLLSLNIYFEDKKDIILIDSDPYKISSIIEYYYSNCDKLYGLSQKGTIKFKDVFSMELQMGPRLKILSSLYNK